MQNVKTKFIKHQTDMIRIHFPAENQKEIKSLNGSIPTRISKV